MSKLAWTFTADDALHLPGLRLEVVPERNWVNGTQQWTAKAKLTLEMARSDADYQVAIQKALECVAEAVNKAAEDSGGKAA